MRGKRNGIKKMDKKRRVEATNNDIYRLVL